MNRKEFIGSIGKSIIGGATILSGCSDLLNQNNPNTLTPQNFWKTAEDAKAGLTAVYQVFGGHAGDFIEANWPDVLIPALYRGDDIGIRHGVSSWWSLALFILTDSNSEVRRIWTGNYEGIFRANQVIHNVPNISMDNTLKKRLIGEAKFLRAYFYFQLILNFKNIPIILSPNYSNNSEKSKYSVAQATPPETWAQIEKDLKAAMNALPATYDSSNQGRVTKGAAMGYLGKVYLYQQKWSNAVPVFEQIINSDNYDLVANFKNIFSKDNQFNSESLLEVNFEPGSFKGIELKSHRNREEALSEAGGWYECYPNQWVFNEMTKEKTKSGKLDPRVYYTILWKDSGMKYYGQSYTDLVGSNSTKRGWMKYSDAELDHTIQDFSTKNTRALRYADVLLMHAESVIRSGGSLSDARNSINKVRNRANLIDLPPAMSKKDVLREIEHQRICELADEGNRWYDLLRWNGSIDDSMSIKQNLTQHGAIGAANFDPGTHKYLPIPLSEINTNTKIKQNPGY